MNLKSDEFIRFVCLKSVHKDILRHTELLLKKLVIFRFDMLTCYISVFFYWKFNPRERKNEKFSKIEI